LGISKGEKRLSRGDAAGPGAEADADDEKLNAGPKIEADPAEINGMCVGWRLTCWTAACGGAGEGGWSPGPGGCAAKSGPARAWGIGGSGGGGRGWGAG
jgi:hypothetical protein